MTYGKWSIAIHELFKIFWEKQLPGNPTDSLQNLFIGNAFLP
jgi:hypothetical protein